MDDHVVGQIGLHLADGDGGACGAGMHLHLAPVLLEEDGHLDFGVLGVLLDMGSAEAVGLRPFLHADISIHRIARPTGGLLRIEARLLREGGRSAVAHVAARDEHGVLVADGTQNIVFPRLPAEAAPDPAAAQQHRQRFLDRFDGRCRLPGRLHDIIGLEEEAGDTGAPVWTMPLGPTSRNGFGALHGGVTFDLVTEAAVGAASRAVGPVEAKSAMVRYLAPATVGPFRAVPVVLPQDDGSVFVRVEVTDEGNGSLLCHVAEVHLAARR